MAHRTAAACLLGLALLCGIFNPGSYLAMGPQRATAAEVQAADAAGVCHLSGNCGASLQSSVQTDTAFIVDIGKHEVGHKECAKLACIHDNVMPHIICDAWRVVHTQL